MGSPCLQLDAGKSQVQGCTFLQEGINVQVGPDVASALLLGNQAPGGFRFDNQAGRRTQAVGNEEDPIEWTAEAKAHYRVQIGAAGDGRYLRHWHGGERIPTEEGTRTMRWSTPDAGLILPVEPGRPYTLTLELNVPTQAQGPEAGVYLDGKRLVPLPEEENTLTVELPASSSDRLILELRCQGWIPSQTNPGSNDGRTLGLSLYALTMRSPAAGERVFNANTGQWIGPSR
jgi:hypothetical protein